MPDEVCTMTREEFIAPVQCGNRRGYTGLQIASSPTLRNFIKAHPSLFERGPINMDVVLIVEPDGTHWHEGLGTAPRPASVQRDVDGLPYVGFAPTFDSYRGYEHISVGAGYAIDDYTQRGRLAIERRRR